MDGHVVDDDEHLKGKPAPDTYLQAAPSSWASKRERGGGVRGRARRASRPGRDGRLRLSSSASTGADQADALKQHGADVVVEDLGELL